jgi:hypothetical protein
MEGEAEAVLATACYHPRMDCMEQKRKRPHKAASDSTTTKLLKASRSNVYWCPREDSNLHGFTR